MKVYCGASDLPKNTHRGSMKECAEKKQIRYYGVKKIDDETLKKYINKTSKRVTVTKHSVMLKIVQMRGRIRKLTRNLNDAKTAKEKKDLKDKLKKTVEELNKNIKIYKELDNVKRMIISARKKL